MRLFSKFIGPRLRDDRKIQQLGRRLRRLLSAAHGGGVDFVDAADFHARRDGAGLLPAFRNEAVDFIIRFTVTDEIQIHGLPFSADGRRQDVRVFFLFQRKENLLMYRVFSVMQLDAPSRKHSILFQSSSLRPFPPFSSPPGIRNFRPSSSPACRASSSTFRAFEWIFRIRG